MKNIAVIPARGGSKRLPGKNLLILGDLPLIAHSILEAKRYPELIDEVWVSTDDAAIKEVALLYGAKVADRPAHLSGDQEPTVSAVKHLLEFLNQPVETIFLLQPTNPLRPEGLLPEAYKIYREKGVKSLFTVTRDHHKLGKIVGDTFVPYNYKAGQRSQDLEPLYYENGLLYLVSSEVIMRDSILGDQPFPLEVNHIYAAVDIDTQDDLNYAAYVIQLKKSQNESIY